MNHLSSRYHSSPVFLSLSNVFDMDHRTNVFSGCSADDAFYANGEANVYVYDEEVDGIRANNQRISAMRLMENRTAEEARPTKRRFPFFSLALALLLAMQVVTIVILLSKGHDVKETALDSNETSSLSFISPEHRSRRCLTTSECASIKLASQDQAESGVYKHSVEGCYPGEKRRAGRK